MAQTSTSWQRLAAVVALLAALLSTIPQGSTASAVVKLRGSNLTIDNYVTGLLPEDVGLLTSILLSNTREGGLAERADFASAYLSNDTTSLVGGVNPLESFATVEANNSYILVSNTTAPLSYEALEILLNENNTMQVVDSPGLSLARSSIRAVRNNWMQISRSTLNLDTSRINFTDYFTWWQEDSVFGSTGSVLNFANAILFANSTALQVQNSTWVVSASGLPAPGGYAGKITPALWLQSSNVNISGTSLLIQDLPMVAFVGSTITLSNSTLQLVNTTAHFYNTTLELMNAEIRLTNSSVFLYANTTTTDSLKSATVYGAPEFQTAVVQLPVGLPLGAVNTAMLPSRADYDLQL